MRDSFETQLVALIPRLRRQALRLARTADGAEDLVQQSLERALRARHRFKSDTNMGAWCATILRNQFISICRKARHETDADPEPAIAQLSQPAAQEHRVALRQVRGAARSLPRHQQRALYLVGVRGLSYEAAADRLGTTTGTVKSRVSRARTSLAKAA